MLACVEEKLTEAAVAATGGDATAFKKYASLTAEANRYRQEAEVFARALELSTRAAQGPPKPKRRNVSPRRTSGGSCSSRTRTTSRSQQMERTIARLDAIGDKREADLWRNELAKLRDTLGEAAPARSHQTAGTVPTYRRTRQA